MLKEIFIFKNINQENIEILQRNLISFKVKKRDFIFHEGQKPDWLYILFKGKIKISKIAKDGREAVLEIINAPDVFGALAVIKNFPYPANAIAMEDCEIGKIKSDIFLQVLKEYPELHSEILHHVTMRLKSGIENLQKIALENVSARIAYQLLKLANKYGEKTNDGILINLKITKHELAELSGTTTETAIRVLSKLKRLGYIAEQNRKILLKDIRALSSLFS